MGRIKYTRETLTQEALKSIIHYDSETGKFTWAVGRGQSNAGGRPGSLDRDGYLRIGIDGTYYGAHRLAWLIHYGEWPKGIVDHINRDKLDNRISNLRDTNCSVNGMNTMRASGKSKSGLRGVAYRAETGRWSAKIKVDGKCIWLGTYATPEEAHEAYMKAKATYHHEHFEDSRSSVDQWQQRATRAEAQVKVLKGELAEARERYVAEDARATKWVKMAVEQEHRATRAEAERDSALDKLQAKTEECIKAKLERDDAMGKCERLERVRKAAKEYVKLHDNPDSNDTEAWLCACMEVGQELDAALAECGEGSK